MIETKEIVQGAATILKELRAYERVIEYLKKRNRTTIIILGASGAGKTAFSRRLRGLASDVSRRIRTSVPEAVVGKLDRGATFKFIDTPGQFGEPYSGNRWGAIQRAMTERNLGIINVTSFGFHEGIVARDLAVTKDHHARQKYLIDRRAEELALLDQWANVLCGKDGSAKWLITLVSKADLWFAPDVEEEVLEYYQGGEYFSRLGEASKINNSVLRFSSHNQMFYEAVPMTGYYTDQHRSQDHAHLIAKILENCAQTKP